MHVDGIDGRVDLDVNGISHRHTGVRSPTTTGKIERFHQSLRREFLADRTFPSLDAAQAELDRWVEDYNTTRPHQALEMATPAERFRLAPLSTDAISVAVDEHDDKDGQWVLRRVGSNGYVSVDNQAFSVGNAFKAELVECSWMRPRSRSGARTTSSERSPGSGPDRYGRCVRTVCTSNISRIRSVKHQLALDTGHPLTCRNAPSRRLVMSSREKLTLRTVWLYLSPLPTRGEI